MGIVFTGGAEGQEPGSDGELVGTATIAAGRGLGGASWEGTTIWVPFSAVPDSTNRVRVEFAVFFPANNSRLRMAFWGAGTNASQFWVRRDSNDDYMSFSRAVNSNDNLTAAGTAPTGVWMTWHVDLTIGNSPDGAVVVYKDSDFMNALIDVSGIDTRNTNFAGVEGVSISINLINGALIDDIVVIDPADGTGWTGCPQQVGAGATADGSQVASWTPSGGAVFSSVNALPPDADTATSGGTAGEELLLEYAQPAVGTPITWISTVSKANHTTPGVHKATTQIRDTALATTTVFGTSTSLHYDAQYTKTTSYEAPDGTGWDRDTWTWEFGLITA